MYGDIFKEEVDGFLIKDQAVKLLNSESSKLPTKTAISQKLKIPANRLGLAKVSMTDLYVEILSEFQSRLLEAVSLASQQTTIADRIQVFLTEIITRTLRKPHLAHLLSQNNNYKSPQIHSKVLDLQKVTYISIQYDLINPLIQVPALATTVVNIVNDFLNGVYLNISKNISETTSDIFEKQLKAQIVVLVKCFNFNKKED